MFKALIVRRLLRISNFASMTLTPQNLADLKEVVEATGGDDDDLSESKVAHRLRKKVGKLVGKIDSVMESLEREREVLEEDIAAREGEIQRSRELEGDSQHRQQIMDRISEEK